MTRTGYKLSAMSDDPFADPKPLIRRVYSYVAYRIGDGPDAEDVTSEAVERALRYRASFDPRKGKPQSWLVGIARSCVDDFLRGRSVPSGELGEMAGPDELERGALLRISVDAAVAALGDVDRELIALRYGADLSTRQIAELLEMKAGAVDVALHRARERLRGLLEEHDVEGPRPARTPLSPAPAER
jgi:RNA polymerase sigma factor (sigma-70 family)